MIESLTPEQEVLFSSFVEKWRLIALSTEPIDRQKAVNSVGAAYDLIGKKQPEIIFCRSPDEALLEIWFLSDSQKDFPRLREIDLYLGAWQYLHKWWRDSTQRHNLHSRWILRQTKQQIYQIQLLLSGELFNQGRSQMGIKWRQFYEYEVSQLIESMVIKSPLYNNGILYDFYIAILRDNPNPWEWQIFRDLIFNCDCIFAFEGVCFVCDRPRILSFDSENRLHAEGSPAIQFADGFGVYAYHDISLPENYGKLHPSQWQSHWLLSEENAELRRVLIQGIGYDRLCQELRATELDSWQDYSLLRVDKTLDREPIHLLKMKCPSTGYIHALRVPPNLESARDAVRWVNWGIDPEAFSVQT